MQKDGRVLEKGKFFLSSGTDNSTEVTRCIHLTAYFRCDVLNVKECIGEKCSFRQTADEAKRSSDKWKARIMTLDGAEQKRIADKYWGGKIPQQETNKERI